MSEPRVVIHGGTIVTSDGPVRADLIVRGEQIAGIVADAGDIDAAERIDATGLVVVPGGVDVHTHFRDPDPNAVRLPDPARQGSLVRVDAPNLQVAPLLVNGDLRVGVIRPSRG